MNHKLHQIIEYPAVLFPPVDDEEWASMTEEEKDAFIAHLNEADKYETETLTIDDLEQMIRDRKRKLEKE